MGKWATYQRRGGGVVPPANSAVLSWDGGTNLLWTWSGTDPDTWEIDQAPSATGPWSSWDSVAGTQRSDSNPDTGFWYSVIGLDSLSNPVTDRSNAVEVP